MPCYITNTSSFLPGEPVLNDQIERYLGSLDGEAEVKRKVLSMNGITQRHYAQDAHQQATHDVYELGTLAMRGLADADISSVSYLSAGTTYAPLSGPGIASLLHARLRECDQLNHPVEISSHAGICSSASSALVGAIRAIDAGQHRDAICVGAEHASEVLKSSVIRPIDDRHRHNNLRDSQWFMSVFLRFMLSDGAGAFLLQQNPSSSGLSLQVNWTHSASFAHEAPLCMKLENRTAQLSQNLSVLSRFLLPTARKFVAAALETNNDTLDSYRIVLPHMSSFFFRRQMERVIAANSCGSQPVPYWTNLATAGNTGAASIYIMLDEFLRNHPLDDAQKVLLFVPESGQFNFVMVSLTAVVR